MLHGSPLPSGLSPSITQGVSDLSWYSHLLHLLMLSCSPSTCQTPLAPQRPPPQPAQLWFPPLLNPAHPSRLTLHTMSSRRLPELSSLHFVPFIASFTL